MEIIKCVRAYAESSFCEKELVLNMDGIAALMGLLGGMLLFTWVILIALLVLIIVSNVFI